MRWAIAGTMNLRPNGRSVANDERFREPYLHLGPRYLSSQQLRSQNHADLLDRGAVSVTQVGLLFDPLHSHVVITSIAKAHESSPCLIVCPACTWIGYPVFHHRHRDQLRGLHIYCQASLLCLLMDGQPVDTVCWQGCFAYRHA